MNKYQNASTHNQSEIETNENYHENNILILETEIITEIVIEKEKEKEKETNMKKKITTDINKKKNDMNVCTALKECPICFEELELSSLVITTCGHILCLHCAKLLIHRNKQCPICSHSLGMKRFYFIIY